MHHFLTTYVPALLFLAACALFYLWDAPISYLSAVAETHTAESGVAFVLMLFVATVFAPITVMPAIPMLAPVFGPFQTGLMSIVGWTLGAMVAFLISRYFGRPILVRFVDLQKLDEMAARIPENTRFLTLILMRMAIPVDLLSYALGLIKTIRFWPYTIATVIGVSWFSFAFAYLGDAFFESNWFVLGVVGALSVVLFILCWFILLRHSKF